MPPNTYNAERADFIAQALDTPESRTALASAMVDPIRRALDYQAIGRSLFMVDELPQGGYAHYERGYAHYVPYYDLDNEENIHHNHLFLVQKNNLEKLKENMNKNKTAISWISV
jgi:hypothetical protein